ncbi:polyphosphate kinase 2 [Nitrosophilus alvini]|uniref:polyphosphate kinase 2 n=1 Tax=Nitrosophilus alvini TaxID=2714855 RepID=UPI00190BD537|nr:polyphosphate kinase 2 [Nitrosophilus alvini]
MEKEKYKKELYHLQVELVKFQRHVINNDIKVCVLIEGRDAAGKDGTIKRFTEHMSPRDTRIVALGKPTEIDKKYWYFQRYIHYLPRGGEIVFFNRSWYNRAGVEKVMGFCTKKQYEKFMEQVPNFEHLLVHDGMLFFKYYLDISKEEQKRRLEERKKNPLKQWKLSPIDDMAQKLWKEYSLARDEMFSMTHFAYAPWTIVRADDKKNARLNIIKNFLSRVDYPEKDEKICIFDPNTVFDFDISCYEKGMIAP